ncbi:unnamed protein product [Cuscuta epithymum]|uniref:Glabrous enhancer-binding protein-like DBD domain-containing protein n=1 Tax=Cuscuta epithymum TaxID=186058 RepID=A0AAV0D977_9ASTE|nr:unnamed protein product [Cuscuta epithymum]
MAPEIAPVDRPLPAASSDEDATSYATSDEDEQKSEQEEVIDQSGSDYSSGGEHEVFKPDFGQKPQSSSESDDSSADSQEGEASPSASGFALLPRAASKTTPTFSPNVTESPKQVSSRPSGKRDLDAEMKDSQKKKKKSKTGEEVPLKEVKKSGANRLWSEDDQIAILKGKIDYEAERGTRMRPISFYDFIKDKLNASLSKSQISDKISRLKKNFLTLYEKGEVPTSDKPHERMVYELSEQIWGTSSSANAKSPDGTSDIAKPNAKNANGKRKRLAEENDINHSMKAAESEAVSEKKKKKKIGHKDKESEKKKKQKTAPEEKDEQSPAVEKDKQTAGKGKHNHSASKVEKDSETDKRKKKKRKSAPEEKYEQTAVVEKHEQTAGKVEGSHSASKETDIQTDEKKKKKKQKSAPEEKDEPTAVVEKDKHAGGKGKDSCSASKEKDSKTDEKKKKKKLKTDPDGKDEQIDAVEKCKQITDKGKDNHSASTEKQKRTANKDKDNHFASVVKYSLSVAKVNDGKGDYIAAKENHKQVALKDAIHGEVKNEEGDFQYKYPYLFDSFNKENYPKTDQETLDVLKENVILIDSSKAAELEKTWTKLWEQKVKFFVKVGDMFALQARFMLDAMKR